MIEFFSPSAVETLSARFRAWSAFSAALLGAAVGFRAALFGPGGFVGLWQKFGASDMRIISDLYFDNADAVALPVGASGSGNPIEYLGGSDPVSWSSGLILDGSGSVALPGLGSFEGHGVMMVSARCVPTVTTPADGQAILVGTAANSRTVGTRGGVRRAAGTWYSAWSILNPVSPTTGGATTSEYIRTVSTGTETLPFMTHAPGDSSNQYGSYIAGAYSGDEAGTSDAHQSGASASTSAVGFDDHQVILDVREATGALTARFTRLRMSHIRRNGGTA